ncbi:MAG TPA: flagellar FlbD family protein [Clostridia bacterium]|nr:MAG: Flagellar protein (FlbD) [Firmicutes bacterium ADurb.Bin356]HOR13900.1 flagellar FlbD family protein [Clostridia bacterium]
MIRLSRLNKEHFLVNSDLIEFVEETPHTVLSMMSGRKLVVSETSEEVRERVIAYKQKVFGVERLNTPKEQG